MTSNADVSIYKIKFVAFVDLLGFRRTIEQSADDPIRQKRISEVLATFQRTACENEAHDICLTGFSDNLVMSAAVTPYALDALLGMIGQIARNLIQKDILIRGGISLGPIHHAGSLTFGPAMNEAYSIENEWAVYPAVVLSNEVVARAKEFGSALVCSDPHRPHLQMLDYLLPFRVYTKEPMVGGVVWDDPARLIALNIQRRLYEHRSNPNLLAKAKWIEAYWNASVGEKGILPTSTSPIDTYDFLPADEQTVIASIGGEAVEITILGQSLHPDDGDRIELNLRQATHKKSR